MVMFTTHTGLSPSMVRRSRRLLLHEFRQRRPKLPHLPQVSKGIRFVLFRVHSLLLTESRLISFPRPTKMLHSGRFPFPNGNVAKRQEVLFGNLRIQETASPCSLSQLSRLHQPSGRAPQTGSVASRISFIRFTCVILFPLVFRICRSSASL